MLGSDRRHRKLLPRSMLVNVTALYEHSINQLGCLETPSPVIIHAQGLGTKFILARIDVVTITSDRSLAQDPKARCGETWGKLGLFPHLVCSSDL
jgi:hypothetical protein